MKAFFEKYFGLQIAEEEDNGAMYPEIKENIMMVAED
jgi:hypothetical protein